MNVVAAVEALDHRAMTLCKKEDIRRDGKKVCGHGLIESNRLHPAPTEYSRG